MKAFVVICVLAAVAWTILPGFGWAATVMEGCGGRVRRLSDGVKMESVPATPVGNFVPVGSKLTETYKPAVQEAYRQFEKRAASDSQLQKLRAEVESASSVKVALTDLEGQKKRSYAVSMARHAVEMREQEIFREELSKAYSKIQAADGGKLNPFVVLDSPVSWSIADSAGKQTNLPIHLAQAFTFDHHGPFLRADKKAPVNNEKRNSTKQVVDHIESIVRDKSLTPKQRAEQLRQLSSMTVSTDNLGDGILAMWVLRNAEEVANDPQLRKDILAATFYEDFGLFGTKYDDIVENKTDNPTLSRGKQIAQALLQEYDQILRDARERNPDPRLGVNYSDRFNMLSAEEQGRIVAEALNAVDRNLSRDPLDEQRRQQRAREFEIAIQRAIPLVEASNKKMKSDLVAGLIEKNYDPELASTLVDEFSKDVFIAQSLDPNAPGLGRFSTWAALPRSHDKNTQIEIMPRGPVTGYIQAHGHGRAIEQRFSPASNQLRELNVQRAVPDAEKARDQAKADAMAMGKNEAEARDYGQQAYEKVLADANFAVGGRPGDSDFNFSFMGVRAPAVEVLQAHLDAWLAARQEQYLQRTQPAPNKPR